MGKQYDTDIPDRLTADGVVARRGDTIWTVRCYGVPSKRKVTRDLLRIWTWWELHKCAYIDERNAVEAALRAAEKALAKAKQDARSKTRLVDRLKRWQPGRSIPRGPQGGE
jgi:hypothetical protein